MPHAIRIYRHGGPEVLSWERVDLPPPAPGEVTVRQVAVGLNFIDTYHRTGLYPLALPSGLGQEAAGVVEALGDGVSEFQVGDRVCYAGGPVAAYAEVRNIPAHRLLRLPENIAFETAAAMSMQGLTAAYLLRHTYKVKAGDWVLIHAAAGGVGMIAAQWAKALGARVIGTVGSAAKVDLARQHGCDYVIDYSQAAFAPMVREITGGAGVAVVYDGVGQATFEGSLDCLRPMGLMVSFGNASGPVPPVDLIQLSRKGSLFITRPTLVDYTARPEDLQALGQALFEAVAQGWVKIEINQRYALRDAAQAHRDLEGRRTTGSSILVP